MKRINSFPRSVLGTIYRWLDDELLMKVLLSLVSTGENRPVFRFYRFFVGSKIKPTSVDTESKKFYFRTGPIFKATGPILGMKNSSFLF